MVRRDVLSAMREARYAGGHNASARRELGPCGSLPLTLRH